MRRPATATPEVQVATHGHLPPDASRYAREKVASVFRKTREPVLYARVRLSRLAGPAMERPVTAQANVDVGGRPVRAHVAAPTATEAVDLLHDRLANRLARLAEHWEARRGRRLGPGPHEWRHGAEPAHRPDHFPRPAEERRVVRHKSYSLERETPEEAAWQMEEMDYTFHLFTDSVSGRDSVLYRPGPSDYRLAQAEPDPDRARQTSLPLTVSGVPAPRLHLNEAKERLHATGFPFVFFVNEATGRGNILYLRYDGHYGLIAPAA